jgi:hypothetical protein
VILIVVEVTTMTMKISIRVTQTGAANWLEEAVEIARPIEDWTEDDLHQLFGKMFGNMQQLFISGQNPVATRQQVDGGWSLRRLSACRDLGRGRVLRREMHVTRGISGESGLVGVGCGRSIVVKSEISV